MIDFVEMKCKYCGGQLTAKDETHVHCPYCGKDYMIDVGSPDKVVNVYQTPQKTDTGDMAKALIMLASLLFIIFIFCGAVFLIFSGEEDTTTRPALVENDVAEGTFLSPLFEAITLDAFGKTGDEVTEEELAAIRYFSLKSNRDYYTVSYSTEMPDAMGIPTNIHTLQLDAEKTRSNLNDLIHFKGLVSLDLGSYSIPLPLKEHKDLKMISTGNSIEYLAGVVDPAQLTVLSLNGSVTDLDRLVDFPALTSLSVDSSKLTDIRGLSALKNLTSLSLDGCDMVTDYSVLYTLPNLQSLSLSDTAIKEIGFVANMPKLSSFTLDDSDVLDLSPLADCTSLTSLVLSDCSEASDFTAVDSLTGLTTLKLSLYSTQKMPALTALPYLESLSISGAEDISFLASMPQLKELFIYNCDVSRYDAFSAPTNLETLSLKSFWGEIPDLSFLHSMPNLKSLDLSGGQFYGAIDDAFCLQNLEALDVSDCSFALNTNTLVPCESLQSLNLDRITLYTNVNVQFDGPITTLDYDELSLADEIGFLQNYPNLTELSVSGNKLSELSFTEALPLLETLNISENYFTDLRPLDKLTHLKTVYCADNAITKYPVSEKIVLVQ